jgi:integrase
MTKGVKKLAKLKIKLTKKVIDAAKPDKDSEQTYVIWDTEIVGFGLHVALSGRKTFVLRYRTTAGEQRKPVLGTYGSLTLVQARQIATEMLSQVRAGGDPSAARKEARRAITVAEACDQFMKEHAARKKPHTRSQYETIVRRYVKPTLGNRKVEGISHSDIARLVSSVGKDYPVMANRIRAMLSKLFTLAEKWGVRPANSNPVLHIDRYSERKRHRDLSEFELAKLAKALEEAEREAGISTAINAIRVLLFSGMRRNEVLELRWSEVDLDRFALRLGDSKTGQKTVQINSAACDVISSQERLVGVPYVFPSQQHPGAHLTEWELRKAWEKVREKAALGEREDKELPAFRLHDLRHNFAAAGTAQNFSLQIVGALLGHRNPKTTARYAALQDSPARQAAETIGRKIAEAMKSADKIAT